jgi:predicted transcriptional regulator
VIDREPQDLSGGRTPDAVTDNAPVVNALPKFHAPIQHVRGKRLVLAGRGTKVLDMSVGQCSRSIFQIHFSRPSQTCNASAARQARRMPNYSGTLFAILFSASIWTRESLMLRAWRRLKTRTLTFTFPTATLCSTTRGSDMDHDVSGLGDLEREVLELVWKQDSLSADGVQKLLNRRLKESTIRTVLSRLEKKGYLRHTTENRAYIYTAVESRITAAARAVKGIIDRFCNGSVEDVLAGMVDAKILDTRELQRLAQKIAKAKKG